MVAKPLHPRVDDKRYGEVLPRIVYDLRFLYQFFADNWDPLAATLEFIDEILGRGLRLSNLYEQQ
jgi:hypothetical protein